MLEKRDNKIITRKLNARENYRYQKYEILPIDAIRATSSMKKVIERFHPKELYRYGCELDDTFISIVDNDEVNERKNLIFHLRGFLFQSTFFYIFFTSSYDELKKNIFRYLIRIVNFYQSTFFQSLNFPF